MSNQIINNLRDIKRGTQDLVERNIPIIRELRIRKKIERNIPIMAYQMAKVGSTSIVYALQRAYDGYVGLTHNLAACKYDDEYYSVFGPSANDDLIYKYVVSRGKPINIISPVREPVGHNISHFFESFEMLRGKPLKDFSIEELHRIFWQHYPKNLPLIWFDKNIKQLFDIDVYEKPFPDSGVVVYKKGHVNILVMKFDMPNNEKEIAIRNFLGHEQLSANFEIKRENVSASKWGNIVSEFKSTVKMPASYMDMMCSSKFFNHFYSKSEIEAIMSKWAGNIAD